MVEPNDKNGLIVTIDLGIKTLKAFGVYPFENLDPSMYAFRFCNLAGHLDMSPGIELSACIKTTERGSSANDPDSKSVSANVPISCKPRSKPRPRRALAETNCARNEAQCILPNDHISQHRYSEDSNVESTLKLRRLLVDGKMKRAPNPWANPLHNLQCFGMLDNRGRPEVDVVLSALAATTQSSS